MIERKMGEITTFDTRGEANEKVDKHKRYQQIIECLKESPEMTAKEIAVKMMEKGYIPFAERNFSAPRLTELSAQGVVEPVGKKKCEYTGQTVTVYSLREEKMNFARA